MSPMVPPMPKAPQHKRALKVYLTSLQVNWLMRQANLQGIAVSDFLRRILDKEMCNTGRSNKP